MSSSNNNPQAKSFDGLNGEWFLIYVKTFKKDDFAKSLYRGMFSKITEYKGFDIKVNNDSDKKDVGIKFLNREVYLIDD